MKEILWKTVTLSLRLGGNNTLDIRTTRNKKRIETTVDGYFKLLKPVISFCGTNSIVTDIILWREVTETNVPLFRILNRS